MHLNECLLRGAAPGRPAVFGRGAGLTPLCEAASAHPPGREARLASEKDTEVADACARVEDFLASIAPSAGRRRPRSRPRTASRSRSSFGSSARPVYLEAPSGLREDERLRNFRIHVADRLLPRARGGGGYPIDGVLRIGGVPTAPPLARSRGGAGREDRGLLGFSDAFRRALLGALWSLAEPGRVFRARLRSAPVSLRTRADGVLLAADRELAGKLARAASIAATSRASGAGDLVRRAFARDARKGARFPRQ